MFRLCGGGVAYLFIDEMQNVKDYEEVVNAYSADGGFSIFITGSNSYLLSGELATKLTGRYVEFEMFTLSFSGFWGMKAHLGKEIREVRVEFDEHLRYAHVFQGVTMEYRICNLPAFRFAGVMARVPMQFEGENQAIAELARNITDAQRAELHRLQDMEPWRVVNASWNSDTDFQQEAGSLTHLIGVLTQAREAGEGLVLVEVPALTWAVFPSDGPYPQAMQQTTASIYAEWLADAPWELDGFRMFSFSDVRDDGTAYSEVWVPVRAKA